MFFILIVVIQVAVAQKSLYKDEEGDWILKFRHINDPKDMGKMEYQYNKSCSCIRYQCA